MIRLYERENALYKTRGINMRCTEEGAKIRLLFSRSKIFDRKLNMHFTCRPVYRDDAYMYSA